MRTARGSTRDRRHAGWRKRFGSPWLLRAIASGGIPSTVVAPPAPRFWAKGCRLALWWNSTKIAGRRVVRGERYRAVEGGQAVLSPRSGSCTRSEEHTSEL